MSSEARQASPRGNAHGAGTGAEASITMNERQQRLPDITVASMSSLAESFNAEEWRALMDLRVSYQQDHDLLSIREKARLGFVRWLVMQGRLEP